MTTSWDGEPSVQRIWYHTHEANISVNALLNGMCHMAARTHAFAPCLCGHMWTVLYSSGACSLQLCAPNSLVASRQEVACVWWLVAGGWQHSCLCLTVQHAFICSPLEHK